MLYQSIVTLFVFTSSILAGPGPATPEAERGGGEAAPAGQGGERAVPAPGSMVPDLTPPVARRDWQTEHRFLQVGTGVSWALVGLGTLGMAIPLGMLSRCNAADRLGGEVDCSPERRTAGITAPILGIMTLASLVPAVLFTRRLVAHKRERPTARLRFTPGGLAVQF